MKIPSLLIIISLLVGCSEPTVDTTTDDSMKLSIEKIKEALPQSKKSEFDEAVKLMTFSQLDLKSLMLGGAGGIEIIKNKIKASMHGKTGDQIIAEANQMQKEREQKQKEQALQEIKELEAKKLNSSKARDELKSFEILRSRFYQKEREYIGKQPIVELTVKNGTTHPVSRAYFKGTIASPERSVPWHEDTFSYSISGGLEPGEQADWSLAPNMFSDWGKVDPPEDAIFTVTVERLDGADGKAIFSTSEFGEREEKRLAELHEKYNIK